MRLPDVENAEIPESKITRYLLSTTHRSGKSKASFFMQFGFDLGRWEALALALKQHALEKRGRTGRKDNLWDEVHYRWTIESSRWKMVKCPGCLVH